VLPLDEVVPDPLPLAAAVPLPELPLEDVVPFVPPVAPDDGADEPVPPEVPVPVFGDDEVA
jgi:hypothetical protein